jgi:hypothetical protein
LRELGAKALVGCDPAPNTEQLNDNLRKAEMRKSDFFQCKVEEMPEELKGSFDSAVIFNVSVPYYERLDFFKAIREMVNTDGKMILAIAEHDLVNDYWKVVNEAGFRVIQKKNLVRLIYINDQLSIDTFTDSQKMNYPDSTILIAAPTPSQ